MIPIPAKNIGGGRVERPFTMGGKSLPRGTVLSAEEVCSIRPNNRSSLVDKGYLHVWPKEALSQGQVAQPPDGSTRHVVHRAFGKYDVVEGVKLNQQPLDKESAYLLAGLPLPPNGEKDKAAH